MNIGWHEQNETDVAADDGWLGPRELAHFAAMRFPKRRTDWRLGRWTAKCAVSAYLGLLATRENFRGLEIRPAPSGAPEAFWANRPAAVTISLSHRSGIAVCAVAQACDRRVALGCDIERIEPHSDVFLADYFTVEEQSLVQGAPFGDRWLRLALVWSAKESLLKALHLGLRVDTRSVNVRLGPRPAGDAGAWQELSVHHAYCGTLHGWWRENAGFVRTLLAAPLLFPRRRSDRHLSCQGLSDLLGGGQGEVDAGHSLYSYCGNVPEPILLGTYPACQNVRVSV